IQETFRTGGFRHVDRDICRTSQTHSRPPTTKSELRASLGECAHHRVLRHHLWLRTLHRNGEFGNAKQELFESFLTLTNGIPSHDTFGRVFAVVPPETLMQTLATWRTLQADQAASDSEKSAVHIDGKTMRSTGRGQALVQLVGAWASEEGLALGQVAV